MSTQLSTESSALCFQDSFELASEAASPAQVFAASLHRWFGVEFAILDATSGDLLVCPHELSDGNWDTWGFLCRMVAERGRPEVIADEDSQYVLAIPTNDVNETSLVAACVFAAAGAPHSQFISLPAESALRIAERFLESRAAEQHAKQLERDVEDLSLNLSSTYEEISLIYRLTQNLKLSSKDEELGALALGWLADVIPAESFAIQLTPVAQTGNVDRDARTEPTLSFYGPCPCDCDQFTRLLDRLGPIDVHQPLIVHGPALSVAADVAPGVRELLVVPLCEGQNVFGYLAAFNHCEGREFGTVEASLLSSVAAILGIHSGNIELYRQQREFLRGVVRALTSAIDAKDPYTCGHSDRVARVAVRLAEEMGCDAETLNTIYLSGLLHDIGKIGIDDNVLRKPGKLTDIEYEHIKLHSEIGYRILKDLRQLDEVLPVVLHHHEQWDGRGYPHQLAGEEIPVMARIVAVADAFDAMGSDRPYRQGMPEERLDQVLREGAGKQWDAQVVEAFFRARDEIRQIFRRDREPQREIPQWI